MKKLLLALIIVLTLTACSTRTYTREAKTISNIEYECKSSLVWSCDTILKFEDGTERTIEVYLTHYEVGDTYYILVEKED